MSLELIWLMKEDLLVIQHTYFGLLGTILKTAKKYGKPYHNPYDEKPDFPKKLIKRWST